MIIVDSGVWIDYFNGRHTPHTDWLDEFASVIHVATFDLILCEVLQGFHRPREFESAKSVLQSYDILQAGGSTLALRAAENYALLRRRGITIRKTIDTLIATACILGGHELLHNDRDFDPFERHLGLRVVHP